MEDFLIKLWFYLKSGLNVINDFKYLVAGTVAVYVLLKLSSIFLFAFIFFGSLPVIAIIGYVYIHKISKVQDQLSTKYGTHYGIKQFELIEQQVALLEEILKYLKK